jgi:hypothetical protein
VQQLGPRVVASGCGNATPETISINFHALCRPLQL